MKPKKPFMAGYKTYDTSKGFGSPEQWRDSFQERMGLPKANEVLGKRSPWEILGLLKGATLLEVKNAYRRLALEHHPDRNFNNKESEAKFKEVGAAFEILEDLLKDQ